eukprot:scaffold3148_cov24-Tisochrysis_lutea.AAC.1
MALPACVLKPSTPLPNCKLAGSPPACPTCVGPLAAVAVAAAVGLTAEGRHTAGWVLVARGMAGKGACACA